MNNGIIFGNKILDVVFVAWFIAQVYKVISELIFEKKIDLKRIFETGGMPSSHSSTMSSLTTAVWIKYGGNTPEFAISFIVMTVVMYDAAGIRRAAGTHAGLINTLIDKFASKIGERLHDKKLKELLGHTPLEVLAGCILGIIIAFLFKPYLLN